MAIRTIFGFHDANFDLTDDLKSFVHPPLWKSSLFWSALILGAIVAICLVLLRQLWPRVTGHEFVLMFFAVGVINLFGAWLHARRSHEELQRLFDLGELVRTPADPTLRRLVAIVFDFERQLLFAFLGAMWLVVACVSLFPGH